MNCATQKSELSKPFNRADRKEISWETNLKWNERESSLDDHRNSSTRTLINDVTRSFSRKDITSKILRALNENLWFNHDEAQRADAWRVKNQNFISRVQCPLSMMILKCFQPKMRENFHMNRNTTENYEWKQ